jgi:hypothetical protein
MKNIVVLGAGLGGLPMAFELQDQRKPGETLTVVSKEQRFHFTPSNPWVAVGWRKHEDIEVQIGPVLAKRGIAIPPVEATPVATGVPKMGFSIESMVNATAQNIRALLDDRPATQQPTWNATCLADFGDKGTAFVAIPDIPPRNVNWSSQGK